MEYKVILCKVRNPFVRNVEKATKELERQVNEQLRAGWEPAGGIALASAGSAPYLFQAVVRR
jgi:hypothetical protein